jgi:hypothetical protein
MLQQLALIAFRFKSSMLQSQHNETIKKSKSMPAGVGVTQVPMWVTALKVMTSLDGQLWTEHDTVQDTGLRSASDIYMYNLSTPTACKFLKIVPLACDSTDRSIASVENHCALRIQIYSEKLIAPKRIHASPSSSAMLKTDLLFTSLKQHEFALEKLISAAEFLWKQEERRRAESQLVVQKVCRYLRTYCFRDDAIICIIECMRGGVKQLIIIAA